MDTTQQREEIAKLWNANGREASDAGTQMHNHIEFWLNELPTETNSVEFKQFKKWWDAFMPERKISAYRTEWSIYDEEGDVAGQIDCLLRTADGKYIMVDWKRVNPTPRRASMPMELLGPSQKAFKGECGFGPCCDLPSTSFWHYVVQQRLYTYILEKHYDITIESSWLCQLHPAMENAHVVEVPRIDDIVEKIMQERYEEVRAKRAKHS